VPPLNEDVVERIDDCPESIGDEEDMVGASSAELTVIVLDVPELAA